MAKLIPLAPDSAGFKVLSRLYDLGGVAFVEQLTEVLCVDFRSAKCFEQIVVIPLTMRGLITLGKTNVMRATAEGRLLIDAYRRTITGPRVLRSDAGQLDPRHCQFGDTRPGALDYRDIPSLMSGRRVPFRGSGGGEES
jgi:hypothetical protein